MVSLYAFVIGALDFSARVKAVASESSQGTGSGAVISTGAPDSMYF